MYSIHYGGRWVWLAAYMPVQNITGGWMALVMVTYSFIADNSSPRWGEADLSRSGKLWEPGFSKDPSKGLSLRRKILTKMLAASLE